MKHEDKEVAVEALSHSIAASLHAALAHRRMTVRELKSKITGWDAELVESMLLGVQPERIKATMLSDVAFILDFHWNFSITPQKQIEPEKKAA